jgi:methylglyoxal reductase
MQYRTIANTGIKVSVVGLGTWAMGGDNWGPADDKASIATIQHGIDLGITLVDTAPVYGMGHSEELVGKAVAGRRDKTVISTKCGLLIDQGARRSLKPDDMRRELDASLKRLQTDVIDIYFCHWPDDRTPIADTIGELVRMQQAGKIRCFGLSNHTTQQIDSARTTGPVACLQDQYSLLKRGVEEDLLPYCQANQLSMFAYAPLGGGILTGKYKSRPTFPRRDTRSFFYPFFREPLWSKTQDLVSEMRKIADRHKATAGQVAIAWTLFRPEVCTALVGARTPEQATSNAAAGDLVLDESDVVVLSETSRRVLQKA